MADFDFFGAPCFFASTGRNRCWEVWGNKPGALNRLWSCFMVESRCTCTQEAGRRELHGRSAPNGRHTTTVPRQLHRRQRPDRASAVGTCPGGIRGSCDQKRPRDGKCESMPRKRAGGACYETRVTYRHHIGGSADPADRARFRLRVPKDVARASARGARHGRERAAPLTTRLRAWS